MKESRRAADALTPELPACTSEALIGVDESVRGLHLASS